MHLTRVENSDTKRVSLFFAHPVNLVNHSEYPHEPYIARYRVIGLQLKTLKKRD